MIHGLRSLKLFPVERLPEMKRAHFLISVSLVILLASTFFSVVQAANEDNVEAQVIPVTRGSFAALDSPDTLRTNLWVAEALMSEIVNRTLLVLPAAPARIRLESASSSVMDDLFHNVASGILLDQGYELYVQTEDPENETPVDIRYSFDVESVELAYPDVHRTLGLWKSWVARELNVSTQVIVSLEETGQLLLSQRVVRRFSDRVEADDLDSVESTLYDFTTAELSEGGWLSRIEEFVVLGTLAGLIAIYFSNTGN